MTAAVTDTPDIPGRVPIKDVEHELTRQLKEGQAGKPAVRARMSNLIIYTDTPELAHAASGEVPEIVALHPARVLLVELAHASQFGQVVATVSAWCHRGTSGDKICSEQVTLWNQGPDLTRLNSVILGLVIGDLPTNIWWASKEPVPFAGHSFLELAEHVQQVIYDSNGWAEPARAMAATAAWLERFERGPGQGPWRVASDLNWRRLKAWRRLLAQTLDPAAAPGVLDSITEVDIEHGPHAVAQAVLLVSWLASRLGWKVEEGSVTPEVEVSWLCRAAHGALKIHIRRQPAGLSRIHRMRISCRIGGKKGAFTLEVDPANRLAATPEGMSAAARTIIVPPQPLAEMVARQLSDRERDPVFRESMAVARVLARNLIGF
jgi:glucose-6-phosphate dehydrogenase assembly protein OpcA